MCQGPCASPRTGNTCATVSYLRFSRFAGHACETCYRLAQPALSVKESSLTPRWRKRRIQLSLRNAFKQIVPKIRLVNDISIRSPWIAHAGCRLVLRIEDLEKIIPAEGVRMKYKCVWSLEAICKTDFLLFDLSRDRDAIIVKWNDWSWAK